MITKFFSKGLVAHRKVDFGIYFGIRLNRAKVVDYLITEEDIAYGRFYIKSPLDTYDWTAFFQPLYLEAWIVLALFSLAIPFLIAMISSFRKSNVFSQGKIYNFFR